MKKWLLLLMISGSVLATPKQELADRLSINPGFSAQFDQVVTSADGDVMSEGKGQVSIMRPSLFRWETTFPDENVIVSDGETVWYYSPFVEQVSVYSQEQATAQTPFILLTRNTEQDWKRYDVAQKGDLFTLKPVAVGSHEGIFHIDINEKGEVAEFDVVEQDGQSTQFTFNHVKLEVPPRSLFSFDIPEGVEVDDQRNE